MVESSIAAFGAAAANRILGLSRERLIATSRLILAAGALGAIYLDPSEPARTGATAYVALIFFLIFALLCLFIAIRSAGNEAWHLTSHTIDTSIISLVIFHTEGPSSPYFVLYTFVMFAGTLRWAWRGALATGAVLFLVVVGLIAASEILGPSVRSDLDRLLLRILHLLVVSVLFGYVVAYLGRNRERLVQLATWPAAGVTNSQTPDLHPTLAHAAGVLGAGRAVVVWDREDEPFRYTAYWDNGNCTYASDRPDRFGALTAPDLVGRAFILEHAHAPVTFPDGTRSVSQAIDSDLVQKFAMNDVVTAPFAGADCAGRIFFMDTKQRSDDQIRLAEIVALRIGIELEQHILQEQLARAARIDERIRLARDLHDGVLQSLTAAGLQLKVISSRVDDETRQVLGTLQQLLSGEQRHIRAFVEKTRVRADPPRDDFALLAEIHDALEVSKRIWNCEFSLTVEPPNATVSRALGREMRYIINETLANSVQHGQASRVDVSIERRAENIVLGIWNNGRGIEGFHGTYDGRELASLDIGPVSLRTRINELNGSLTLASNPEGVHLNVVVPLRGPAE